MKKQRPHKGSKASKRARKARACANAAVLAHPLAPAHSTIETKPSAKAPDRWAWRTDAGIRGPGRHAKGPPPRQPSSQRTAAAKPAKTKARDASKLAPALVALLDRPIAPPLPPLKSTRWMRAAFASRWREDRIAAVVLLMPTLLVATVLMLSPRQRAPLDQSPVVAIWRGAPPTAPHVVETAPMAGRYPPPFARPAERTMAHVPIARHDLDAVTPALTKDATWAVAMAGPLFARPPERPMSLVPTARHDLDAVAPTLAGDAKWAVAMAGPPFARPPERPMSHVPTARHDLDAVAPTLASDAKWAVAMAGPPFARPPEAATPSVPLAAHDVSTVAVALARDMDASRVTSATPRAVEPPPNTRAPEGTLLSALPEVAEPTGRNDLAVCRPGPNWHARLVAERTEPVSEIVSDPIKFGNALADAAKAQVADLVIYNAKYMTIAYPGGDVPELFGVCTDVVIRAYRTLGIDLQELVHLSRPRGSDASIDHRRTELLRHFFATHGEQLATSPFIEDYLPGDIVTYYRPQNKSSQSHIAVVTDVFAPSGRPMIAHNRGWGVQLEDALFVDQMTGHYRYRGPPSANALVASRKATAAQTASAKLTRPSGSLSATGQNPVPHTELRKGIGRQTAVNPASTVQLASAKPVLASGAQRMGLGMGPLSTEAPAQCAGPAIVEQGDRVCIKP